jgi:hypothetical protein
MEKIMVTATQVKQVHDKNAKISKSWRTRMKDFTDIVFANQATNVFEATATTGGGTTGLIPASAQFVAVTSDSADKQISLPAATVGKTIRGFIGTNGCEVISAVAADKINDVVVGATNEAALVANTLFVFTYTHTNNWLLTTYDIKGEVNVDGITPVVPDALV